MNGFKKIETERYHEYTDYARTVPYGRIYPLSMCESRQSGDIYTDGKSVLFWHFCGFGSISGDVSEAFLYEVKKLMQCGERRLVLFADDACAEYFGEGFAKTRRLFFEYPDGKAVPEYDLPEGFELAAMYEKNIPLLKGRIVPSFSWDSTEAFLKNGTGRCIMHGQNAAAGAFSAAISSEELDIGIETAPEYQRRGLAYCAAASMIEEALRQNKKPVWACHAENTGSAGLAQKLGYIKTEECFVIHTA